MLVGMLFDNFNSALAKREFMHNVSEAKLLRRDREQSGNLAGFSAFKGVFSQLPKVDFLMLSGIWWDSSQIFPML
ncbi:hypothetical protein SOASR014_02780 [Pectobacterium carotovorum subsp. carotovorum]|nr:hypothetical protein SOASR014_02780 [Pectobacterium carotovorum subsp. carotovorum]GLX42858.1 hypothetical protein Pcaca01_05260 [Pectobacterium carotovorum subsp. carotovorum]